MRIYEIDDQDKTFAAAAGVDLDLRTRYDYAVYILETLAKSNSPKRNEGYLSTIEEIESDFTWVINQTFSDDTSTKELKEKATYYLQEIQKMKGML
jgi:hypothetical protein